MPREVFIIGAPRSGTTLLERVLCTSKDFRSLSESWGLLAICQLTRKDLSRTIYGEVQLVNAQKADNALNEIKLANALMNTYVDLKAKNLGSFLYLIDKTPRYYYILDELYSAFPNAFFIVLYRPLHERFFSSLIEFNNNKLSRIDRLYDDLVTSTHLMNDFLSKNNNSRIHRITYHKLVNETEECISELERFLGSKVSFSTDKFSTLDSFHGDSKGLAQSGEVIKNNSRWKVGCSSLIRKLLVNFLIYRSSTNLPKQFGLNIREDIVQVRSIRTWKVLPNEILQLIFSFAAFIVLGRLFRRNK